MSPGGDPAWLDTSPLRGSCEWAHFQRNACEEKHQARREWLVISECLPRLKEETICSMTGPPRLHDNKSLLAQETWLSRSLVKKLFPMCKHTLPAYPLREVYCQLNPQVLTLIRCWLLWRAANYLAGLCMYVHECIVQSKVPNFADKMKGRGWNSVCAGSRHLLISSCVVSSRCFWEEFSFFTLKKPPNLTSFLNYR